jgi:raffinose/stachyose/melibiose transport system permease protein
MVGQYSVNFGELFAFMVLISLPVIIAYLFLQKYFIEGLMTGSGK